MKIQDITEGYGRYYCSTDKKWKTRKGPKQTRKVSESCLKENASKLLSAEDRNGVITVIVQAPDGTKRSVADANPRYINKWLMKYDLTLPRNIMSKFVESIEQGVAEAGKNPHPKTWHDVDKKLGKAVDKMSQAEKVKKGLAHPDTLKKQGVAEGVEIVDQDSDLDQQVFTLNVDGKTVSFTYWDYENNFQNPDIKDIYQQAREQLGKKLSPEQIKAVARAVFKSFKQGVAEATDNTGLPHDFTAVQPGAEVWYKGRFAGWTTGKVYDDPYGKAGKMVAFEPNPSEFPGDDGRILSLPYDEVSLRKSTSIGKLKGPGQGVAEEKQRLDPKCWDGYKKDGTKMKGGVRVNNCVKEELEETYDGDEFFEAYGELWYNEDEQLDEAEYQGRSVPLGKPMQGDVKKFKVYVKDPSTGNVKKVNFGDPDMKIRKSNPAARRSFRARHNCDNPGPRTKARYWSCRKW